MSEYVTLVQLMSNLGNFSHTVMVSHVWVFDANYKKNYHGSKNIWVWYMQFIQSLSKYTKNNTTTIQNL